MVRVVASYTTLPSRYDVLKQSILSLRNQSSGLDAIYLTLPKVAKRLGKEYPPVPDDLKELCTIVTVDEDYGPITKIYGGLISEKDPNTIIISCDDDVLFKYNFVETLLKYHTQYPEIIICGTGALIKRGLWCISIVSSVEPFDSIKGFSGFYVPKNGRKVDLIFGVAGVLYTRGMFPTNDNLYEELFKYSTLDDSIFHNDDVLISGYMSKKGISRKVFYDIPSITHINGNDALSGDLFKMLSRLQVSITKVQEYGFYPYMEEISPDETPSYRVIFSIIIILIIIILCIGLYNILYKDNIDYTFPSLVY
jgi:hypothetical protein